MFDDVLEKYTPKQKTADQPAAWESEVPDDHGAFGWLRGVRDRAVMLEVRHKDGKVSAFGYAWLDHAEFNPSEGITLSFSGKKVTLIGRNLNAESRQHVRLFAGILRHRVPWVQEADGPTLMEASDGETVIEEVKVK